MSMKQMFFRAAALLLASVPLGAAAANLIGNPGFENNPPSAMANNIGHPVTPWIMGSGSSSNVVKVDGPGGYDYYSNGPESDGSAPGAGVVQHYLDIANGSNDLYQSFTVPACPASPAGSSATVSFSGKFSTRSINIGYPSGPVAVGKVSILSGTGTSGSVIATQTASLMAGPSKTSPWLLLSGTATVTRGSTFSYVVTMDDNVNFDDAVVTIDADPCDPVQPPVETNCLKGDAKVTCGRTPGTFAITLVTSGAGGVAPTHVSLTSLTPGVTIVNPQVSYPVIAGAVHVTIAGANPGDVVNFDLEGTVTGAGSIAGSDLCCNGKIRITIPKDLDCWKSSVSIIKTCEPAVEGKYPVSPAATGFGLHANCTIKVTTTGPQTGPITVGDTLAGTGTVVNMTAPAPWTCTTPVCQVNGNGLNQTASTTVISAIAVFANPGDAMEAKNCAKIAVAGKPAGESCVPIVTGEKGKLTVTKEAAYIGNHITNVNFPIAVTCGGVTANASFADGAPYVQGNLPLGALCSVVEGAAPVTGLCGKGQIEAWTTTYAPATPVSVTSGGATIHVKNVLSCKPGEGTIDIKKECEPATEVIGAINHFESMCHITVTTTGPQTGAISFIDSLTGGGVLGAGSAPSPWTCSGNTCSVDGSALNQTSSVSVIGYTVSFPTQGHVIEGKNCAELAVDGIVAGNSCSDFTVEQRDATSVSITKTVQIAGPANLTGILFLITYDCGSGPQAVQLANGQTHVVNGLPAGTVCTVQEGPITANPCGGDGTSATSANWLAPIFQPSQTVAAGPGALVTVVNRVMCEDIKPAQTITITKRVVSNAPDVLPSVAYPVSATCDSSVTAINDGQTLTIGNLAAGTACTVTEGPLAAGVAYQAALDACGGAGLPVWTASYAPSQTVTAAPGASVTITNTLDCREKADSGFYIKKVVVNHAPGSVDGLEYAITSQCSNTTQPNGFAHFSDGETVLFHHYEAGVTCNITEQIPPTTACGDLKPVWTTTYSPSQTVTLSPTGSTLTVTNTLDCEPKGDGRIHIRKVVVNNAPNPIGNLYFIIDSTCSYSVPNYSVTLLDGQELPTFGYVAGATCSLVETGISPTNACGDLKPVWTTTYSPAQSFAMAPEGQTVTVTNTLNCEKVGDTNPTKIAEPKCDPATTITKGGKCVCEYRNMAPVSATACGCTQGLKFVAGKGCVRPDPVCSKNQILVKGVCRDKPPVCAKNQVLVKGRCVTKEPVCGKGQQLVKGRCAAKPPVCGKGQALVKGRCVSQEQKCGPRQIRVKGRCVAVPKCGLGQIPVPGTGLCISVGIGGGGPKEDVRP